MGVATKSRAQERQKPAGKAVAQKARRLQITVSDKTWARLVVQAEDIGVSIPAYATMMLAEAARSTEVTRLGMGDILKNVGVELGKRLPVEVESDE